MLESGSLPSAVMYKFGISSRTVRDLKSQGAALLEEAEKTPIIFNLSPCAEASTRDRREGGSLRRLARSCKIPVTQSDIKERALSCYVTKFCAETNLGNANGHKSSRLLDPLGGA